MIKIDNVSEEQLKKVCAEVLSYFNFDNGTDLPEIVKHNTRVICANVAWCLIDKDRFNYYYNLSDFWKTLLILTYNEHLSKYSNIFIRGPIDNFLNNICFYLKDNVDVDYLDTEIPRYYDYDTIIMIWVQIYKSLKV